MRRIVEYALFVVGVIFIKALGLADDWAVAWDDWEDES